MNFITFLLRNSRWGVIASVSAGTLSGAANIGLLALINSALNPGAGAAPSVWSFMALCLFALAAKVVSEVVLLRLGQKTTYALRVQLWRQILAVPLRRHEELGRHRLLTALTDDVFTIANFVTFLPSLCMSFAIVVGCLFYLGWLSPAILGLVLVFLLVGVTTFQLPVRQARRYFELTRRGQDSLFKQFRALTEGIKELKLHGARRRSLTDDFERLAVSQRRYNTVAGSIFVAAASWGQILFLVLIGLIVLTLPDFGSFDRRVLTGAALALLFMRGPLEGILAALPNLGSAGVALANVEQLGISLLEESEKTPSVQVEPTPGWRSIELVNVTHAYRGERDGHDFTLGPIDLTLRPGELVFLAGGNGSGKTTLAKILTGLYPPESGHIRLDGEVVDDDNREHYRQLFSAVFYDFFLFENLRALDGGGGDLDGAAGRYLERLQLDGKVSVNDGVLSTTELSQGQRKRLALLAAYLEDRHVYVFDEWAADQDPFYKDTFYFELLPELKARGKTLFVITHDDRYYHLADYVIRLDSGQMRTDASALAAPAEPARR
jgi:putative ATP-binding cassette transporter